MTDFLSTMASASQARAAGLDVAELRARAADQPCPKPVPRLGDDAPGIGVIAEYKRRSPSRGDLGLPPLEAQVRAYTEGGAVAISVLTEPSRFGGSLDDLARAAGTTSLPVLRKDFLVDPRQVHEARAAGASGVLVMASLVDETTVRRLLDAARDVGLFVLLETHDAPELDRVHRILADHGSDDVLVGVNTRDFARLEIVPERLNLLRERRDAGVTYVAESGIHRVDDALRAYHLGYRMALVGTALMNAVHPARLLRQLSAAGRSTCPSA